MACRASSSVGSVRVSAAQMASMTLKPHKHPYSPAHCVSTPDSRMPLRCPAAFAA